MSVFALRSSGPPGTAHPAVVDRRLRGLVLIGLAALVPALVALAIAVAVPHPNLLITLALICGVLGVVALMLHPRIEITVALLALYMGLLDGPIRLGFGGGGTGSVGWSAVRDAFIFAIALGAVLRMVAKREPIKLPPLSGWVLALVALVMMEAFNPKTGGTLKILGGFRQQLEWVPFFFFGYAIMRSRERFRKFFLVLGVITLANGVVATYQTQISPAQLESWGPGYKARVLGVEHEVAEGAETKRSGPRVYISEGKARVRPMALGSDSGRGGGLGAIALPGALALLAAAAAR